MFLSLEEGARKELAALQGQMDAVKAALAQVGSEVQGCTAGWVSGCDCVVKWAGVCGWSCACV